MKKGEKYIMSKKINFGSNEDFIKNYENLKSSRKMAELYNCNKTSILNHAKKINYDVNSNKEYKLSNEDKEYIKQNYNNMTSTQLAQKFKVSRGMITKIWYDAKLSGKKHTNLDNQMIDITGKTFGKWTVLYKTNKRNSGGVVYWHCR